ncbi:hypothetical protein SAMN06265361_10932 [Laceyella tengchongensis]|uniref:Immunity MXAN-0049 protein domain-containing protein n=1 Tax=Laceyella tengchongensis TaxID=574699 RepID=A0AA45WS06_9BACL|nr:DUF1629 domain-containing protein [Laceyella tengchongensis]SMP32715.1 hypothetical protein SAMN06265361_10932 [Laceyella tengchongensis]
MKIWQLQSLLNEDFQSLQLVHFEQDYNKYFDKRFFEVEPMFEFWQPVEVYIIEEGKRKSDCPPFWGCSFALVFSERALGVLEDLVKEKVEALPLVHPEDNYWLIHILHAIDAVDYEKAIVETTESGRLIDFEKYAFSKEKVKGEHIFQVYLGDQVHPVVFVSDEFKHVVEANRLVGFEFIEVWDSEK